MSFFFIRILPAPYIVPSNLHPKKQFILPNIMMEEEVVQLFAAPLTVKEYCVIGLLYGCGLRISEVCQLRLQDIESHNQRLKVYQGKGAKDRYTLLPENLLQQLRSFMCRKAGQKNIYLPVSKPKEPCMYAVCK